MKLSLSSRFNSEVDWHADSDRLIDNAMFEGMQNVQSSFGTACLKHNPPSAKEQKKSFFKRLKRQR